MILRRQARRGKVTLKRKVWRSFVAALGLAGSYVGATSLLFVVNTHQTRSLPANPTPLLSAPRAEQRLLVIAPHPDDEVLGCGGLIAQAVQSGAEVRVAVLTQGDGYPAAAALISREKPAPDDFVNLGRLRQQETLNAVQKLGLKPEHALFFGYPDKGLWRLWRSPYQPVASDFTRLSQSPYENSFHPFTAYTGVNLLNDLTRLIREFQPTDVYVTHPLDDHSDHMAAAVFTQEALEQAKSQQFYPLQEPKLHYYLVHRGDWPLPQGYYPSAALIPPIAWQLEAYDWGRLTLTKPVLLQKQTALEDHASQCALMNRFLRSFLRQNELFIESRAGDAIDLPLEVSIDGDPSDWRSMRPTHINPVNDDPLRHMQAGADIAQIHAFTQENRLYYLLQTRGNQSSLFNARFYWSGIDAAGQWHHGVFTFSSAKKRSQTRMVSRGQILEGEGSLPGQQWQRVYLMVDTQSALLKVDRSGYFAVPILP